MAIVTAIHLVVPTGHPGDAFLQDMAQQLEANFGIHHTTLQIEVGDTDSPCVLESDKHL